MTEERSECEYCAGNTKMDDYGQCRACGAPKPTIPQMTRAYNDPSKVWDMTRVGYASTAAIDYDTPDCGWDGGIINWR